MPKKSGSKMKSAGKAATAIGIVSVLSQYVTPEMVEKATGWLQKQHFSDKLIELIKKIHLPEGKDSMESIGYRCDAVEEIIETKSADLPDDAPISQWRNELGKIRSGAELIDKASEKDRKKTKALEQRSRKLFNSVFTAVAG